MTTGTNFLNEHIIEKARVHYAITDTGGISPNVVQAQAEVLYLIRAPEMRMRSRSTSASRKSPRARR
jgi:aminobenzoyl-glutamate utilization protein B